MPKLWVALALGAATVACAPAPSSPATAPPAAATAPAAASAGAASAAPTQPPPATATAPPAAANLQLGVMNSASDAGFFVAEERGLFREQGLNVEFVTFGAAA